MVEETGIGALLIAVAVALLAAVLFLWLCLAIVRGLLKLVRRALCASLRGVSPGLVAFSVVIAAVAYPDPFLQLFETVRLTIVLVLYELPTAFVGAITIAWTACNASDFEPSCLVQGTVPLANVWRTKVPELLGTLRPTVDHLWAAAVIAAVVVLGTAVLRYGSGLAGAVGSGRLGIGRGTAVTLALIAAFYL